MDDLVHVRPDYEDDKVMLTTSMKGIKGGKVMDRDGVHLDNKIADMVTGDKVSSKAKENFDKEDVKEILSILLGSGQVVDNVLWHFDNEDVKEILSILLGSGQVVDTVLWHFDEKGLYNVKSGYNVV
ncbi:hypothetical protein LWI28_027753 [Acer negundo]|uniref:Uncharacterized protein n=1 Tax=Acer negundo TaxID=4023 RepID=A0AAD5IWL1_ACENE|nr:hypothetical protein LWI28_027753 [Acer negundo]